MNSSSSSSGAANGAHSMQQERIVMAFHPSCSFSTSYQRNNKSNGQKNLRCFPGHCFEGHRTGWCGHPLLVRSKGGSANLRLVGSFSPRLEDDASSKPKPKFVLGEAITKHELEDRLRSGLLAECMEGFVEDVPKECDIAKHNWEASHQKKAPPEGCDREFVFNSKSKGWHYGFLGSKKDSNVWHLWSVFALEPSTAAPDTYIVVSRLDSPPFQLFCRRRNRGPLAKARLEASQRILAVNCKCVFMDSTPEEIAAAAPVPVIPDPTIAKEKKTPRKRAAAAMDSAGASSSTSSSASSTPAMAAKSLKKMKQPQVSASSQQLSSASLLDSLNPMPASAVLASLASGRSDFHLPPATSASAYLTSPQQGVLQKAQTLQMKGPQAPQNGTSVARQTAPTADGGEPERRMEMVLDLVRRVQLPGIGTPSTSGGVAAAARRASHSALVLVSGQDATDFGERVLKLAKHWKKMDQRGVPPPVAQAQQFALGSPVDDWVPPFVSFLLGQAEFGELLLNLAQMSEAATEASNVQALRAAERMLHVMLRQVQAVQKMRTDMRLMAGPSSWSSVVTGPTPSSPIPSTTPQFPLALPQELLPSSPLLGLSGLPMTPYLMNQIHRRRMGSNTSTGSDPSVMMTDFDLEWFSKSLDALHADGGAPSL